MSVTGINFPPNGGSYTAAKTQQAVFQNYLISLFLCSTILLVFLLGSPRTQHWFVIPVLACGTLVGTDVVRVIRGQISVFEPIGFLSIIAFHFFFLAPLLHVHWDYWLQYINTSQVDWRYWVGRMAILNLLGIIAFYTVRSIVTGLRMERATTTHWRLNESTFRPLALIALCVAGLLQLVIFSRFGGIGGYVAAYESRSQAFEGYGAFVMVSESFPIIAMMLFVVWARHDKRRQTWLILLSALIVFVIVQFLFGGLRGSRSNTIWALFWAVGLLHFWIRPVPRKLLLSGAIFVLLFMYAYGFYKSLGTDAFDIYAQQGDITAVEQQSGRSLESLLLLDLARTDTQGFVLYRTSPKAEGVDYEFAKGSTYIGALSLLIPSQLWPDRPPTKVAAGTDALYGEGTYASGRLKSSRAYGFLGGETILNFGGLAVPIAYAMFGVIVGLAQRWQSGLLPEDSRLLFAPFVTILSFYLLAWDSDNILFYLIKNGSVPIMVLVLSSRRMRTAVSN